MSQQLLSSKIVIREEPLKVRPIQGASLSDTAMLAITERGPFGAHLVQDGEAYKKLYGGFTPNADGAIAAQMFFDNGGTNLWVSRVVHYSDASNPTSKTSSIGTVSMETAVAPAQGASVRGSAGPFVLAPGDTLIASLMAGGPLTATFAATAATIASTNPEPFVLTDGLTLLVDIDAVFVQATFSTASFVAIGAATAAEVAAVVNAAFASAGVGAVMGTDGSGHLTITTTQRGSGASVEIIDGTANTALGFVQAATPGTGNVANIAAVTGLEVATIAAAAWAGTVGTASADAPVVSTTATGNAESIRVTGGTARTKVGFDNFLHSGSNGGASQTLRLDTKTDGAFEVLAEIQPASTAGPNYFDLIVLQGGAVVEPWPNLSMDPNDPRYVETIVNDPVNGSDYLVATDLHAPLLAPDNNPVAGSFALTGGSDGLVGLVDADFIGSAAGATGLRAFDRTPAIRILIVPGQATPGVHNAMLTYCEAIRFGSMFSILDPPVGMTAQQIATYVSTTASLQESSEFGDIQWPNVKIANPQTTVFGQAAAIVVPPSGAIAGRYARNDAATAGGIYEAPAGVDYGQLVNVIGLETDEVKDENARDVVAAVGVNPIVGLEGLPIHVDGSLTLKSTGPFPTIGERRGIIYIEQSLKGGLVFAKHRKIKPSTLAALDRSTRAFMEIQRKAGAFASDDPKLAYSVNYGGGLNPPSEAFGRRMNGRLGVATAKPGDFIILRVGQDTSALEAELAASAA